LNLFCSRYLIKKTKHMKKYLHVLSLYFLSVAMPVIQAQPVYTSSDFAVNGDTIFLTGASPVQLNFDTTGAGITWNYSSLTGFSQRRLLWRAPSQTGFSVAQWAYIYNPSNVNTSSTDEQTISVGAVQYSDPNDYYLKNSGELSQKASSYRIARNNSGFYVKNVYSGADRIYKFPLNYLNQDSTDASFSTSIPGVYYRETSIHRVNTITGWGTLTTPYGTFTNCLKLESAVTQIDTIAVDTLAPPKDTLYYKEIKWLDPSTNYPLLTVTQYLTGGIYITQKIEYYDNEVYFDPGALFVFYPVSPWMGDTVLFQNLSTNAHAFDWDFGDAASGGNNTSTQINPTHRFDTAGIYYVKLIARNGTLSDTLILPVNVRDTIAPTAAFSWNPNPGMANDTVYFSNASQHGSAYTWNFDDPGSGSANFSFQQNPKHVFAAAGIYNVRLIVQNSVSSDTIFQNVIIDSTTTSVGEFKVVTTTVYPNPASGSTFFSIDGAGEKVYLSLTDETGKILIDRQKWNCPETKLFQLDVSSLLNGIYFVKIEGVEINLRRKLVISH
jgi:PKD repeat protein